MKVGDGVVVVQGCCRRWSELKKKQSGVSDLDKKWMKWKQVAAENSQGRVRV
jgi:hypothetical protein